MAGLFQERIWLRALRCHFDVRLRDESGSLPADLYTPDVELLIGCDAVQLEKKNLPLPFLEARIKKAIEDKHVVCFIKVYDRPVRGVNMRTFPIVKLYAYEDLYPSTNDLKLADNVEPSTTQPGDTQLDQIQEKETNMQGDFFTPTTKKILNEVSEEMVPSSKQDQTTSLKRSLFTENTDVPPVSVSEPTSAQVVFHTEGNTSTVAPMEIKSPIKKNKNREKVD